ncbi:hypothetical protein AtubIFM56815_005965 [Aspergillus tubingensis]|uniref:Uncharacterized protein n=1 Tax=Aspergillus tubingensis TaxID=5068 RepID=A0A9W6AIQ8_ASPTU|nr:hypothetical protein AtubIFM54640_010800 [Aspergillus tubingensis]GLA81787.1 hypothetical protein AtubIFM56815_005965 [Aspergillus tubingensis]GLA97312.1 hypothetical protein AtubIFM57143_004802 [Aspergillus tubingensis]GLB18023.1 hypothetical protein AtubIFM61612_007913 [Aspergillus tubingensis]
MARPTASRQSHGTIRRARTSRRPGRLSRFGIQVSADETAGDLCSRGSTGGDCEAVPELRPEAADAVCFKGAAKEGLPFIGIVEADYDSEKDGEESVAEIEHDIQ